MVADTYSTTLGVLLMGTGNDNNQWGTNCNNSVFQIFEDALANGLTSSISGGTLDLSGSPPPAGPSQVRYAALLFTGSLSANQTVYVPNLAKFWWVNNETSGAFYLSIKSKTSGGTIGGGSLLTLGTLTGGSGYTNGTYYNVPLTGGSGFGAVATVVISGGAVTGVTLTSFGEQYLATDTGLSASNSNIGGTGSGFSINASTVGNIIPQNSGWQLVLCDGNGNVRVAPFNFDQIQMPDGSASAPSYSDVNETNSGLYRHGFQDWRIAINGADVVQITGPSASTASVFNVLAPNSLQSQGVQLVPAGTELAYAGVNLPAGFLWEYGQPVSRATYPNLLTALRAQFTGNVTNGSPTISSVTTDLRNLGLEGAPLEGSGLTGLTISSITATSVTMSGNATAGSGGAQACFAFPYGNGDGSTTFNVPDRRGRVIAGRDNMGTAGSSPAGRLTSAGSGVNGVQLIAAGGAENETVSITVGQANLPAVSFAVSGITLANGNLFGNWTGAGAGTTAFLSGAVTNPNANLSGQFNLASNVSVATQGSAASGGSGTPATDTVTTVQPTGISNYIIKF